jgi:chromosome segregation ATPase
MRGLKSFVAVTSLHVPHGVEAVVTHVTPIQKCVQMLEGMVTKAKNEKHEEQLQYVAYEAFCAHTTSEKTEAIEKADEQIDMLNADLEKFAADVERLTKEIDNHHSDIDGWEKDLKAATEVRDEEKANYMKTHADYTESVGALREAINVLKHGAHDTQAGAALLQHVQALTLIPDEARKEIDAFLQRGEDDIVTAPAETAYEFRSHDIISMLEGLQDKFREKRRDLEEEETDRKQAYDMLHQQLRDSIQASENELADDTQALARTKQRIAEDSATLDDTTASRTDDDKYLKDLTATCNQKADDFAARQKLRGEEIEAVEKAIDILSSDDVSGNAEKHLPAMLQRHRNGTALVQLRGAQAMPTNQVRVAAFLNEQAEELQSRSLAALAMQVRADPFVKVKNLIEELIERLMHEATEEAEHKGWCDTELGTNEHTRKTKSEEVEKLTAEIEGLESKIETLTKDLKDLAQAISDIESAVAERTDIRNNETAENEQAIADAQAGQVAVGNAIKVLKDFYDKADKSKALLQVREDPPEIFDESYNGMQAENGGVLGMLDVINSDFARLEQDTKSAEEEAQAAYDNFMSDSEVDLAAKKTAVEHKSSERHESGMTLDEKKTDLEQSQEQLASAEAYFEKLKPTCFAEPMSYEERVKRRKDEIESLKEALKILSGEDLAALNQE